MNDAKSLVDPMLALIQEKNIQIEMYFIKKTNSCKPEKMNKVYSVGIAGDVRAKFTRDIVTRLNNIKSRDDLKFKNFHDEDLLPEDIAVVDGLTLVPTFRHIEMQMEQDTNLNRIMTLQGESIKGLQSYAIAFKNTNNKLIYFNKYTAGNVLTIKNDLYDFTDGVFSCVEGDVCKFDSDIDCIYYKINNIDEILYILNRDEFEKIFSALDFYKMEAKQVFDKFSLSKNVEIPKYLIDQIQDKPSLLRKLTHVSIRGGFDKIDVNRISNIKKSAPTLKFEVKDNKIIISDRDSFKDFLDVCENNILGDLVDNKKIYRIRYKEPLK